MVRRETAKVLFATMAGTLDTTALLPVIAFYAQFRGADVFWTGVIVGLYSAVHAPANLLFGRLVDRRGRRLPLTLGLLWDAASLVLYTFAATPLLLGLARVSHGLGGGLIGPSTMSLASDSAAPARKGRAMALYGISIATAVVIGTGIATPIHTRFGYDALFFLLAAVLAVAAVVSLTIREPAPRGSSARLDLPRLLRNLRREEPLAGYAAIFSLHVILGTFVTLVPLFLKDDLGYAPAVVGMSFFTFAVASLIFHYAGGVLADRRGSSVPALAGLVVIGTAMVLIPVSADLLSLLLTMLLFGLGHGLVFPASSALVTRGSDPDQVGTMTGVFYAILVLGVAIGAPATAAVAAAYGNGVGLQVSALAAIVGIGFALRAFLVARDPAASPLGAAGPVDRSGNP